MSRAFKIDLTNRENYEYERSDRLPSWLSNFADKLAASPERTAVQVARERNDLTDKINSLVSGRACISPYSSVEDAVKDYQKRTGLLEYHKRTMAAEIIAVAEEEGAEKKTPETPELLKKNPAIATFINNIINTQHGIQTPAVGEPDVYSRDVMSCVDAIIASKKRDQHDISDNMLGRGIGTERDYNESRDPNREWMIGLMPARIT